MRGKGKMKENIYIHKITIATIADVNEVIEIKNKNNSDSFIITISQPSQLSGF